MLILGIETSCDETGVALYRHPGGVLAHRLHSQVAAHALYGGVVPELASRDHLSKIVPLLTGAMREAQVTAAGIDAIAYTAGPGLIGALLVGAAVGQSLAYAWRKPALPIHHLEAHLLAPLLAAERPDFPYLALLVSGGHTQLVAVHGLSDYRVLGATLDDAAGEAFDKTAKLLGLGYPGGAALAALAARGNPKAFKLPRPLLGPGSLDFSFSGLKTKMRLLWTEVGRDPARAADLAAGFQQAIVETLAEKCRRALAQSGMTRLIVSGGVAANRALRARLEADANAGGHRVYFPPPELCTDNGVMIAFAGALHAAALGTEKLATIAASGERQIRAWPRWDLAAAAEPPAERQ